MGGGMTTVCTTDELDLSKTFITIKTLDERLLTINTRFIVDVEPINVAHFFVINGGNRNMPFEKKEYYINAGIERVVFVDTYDSETYKNDVLYAKAFR